jgi:hypothetical protein
VIIAVALVRMMQVAFDEIVGVAAMRNRFMSASSPVRVLAIMRTTGVSRGTSGRIRAALRQSMFIDMPLMGTVKMPVVQIVDVTFVFDRGVPAAWTMRMWVLIMRFVVAHLYCSFWSRGSDSNIVIWVDSKFILGRVRKRIRHQLGDVAVRDGIVLMLSFPPAGDEPSVTKPSEPFRGGWRPFAHRFRQIANAGFLPAQDFHES